MSKLNKEFDYDEDVEDDEEVVTLSKEEKRQNYFKKQRAYGEFLKDQLYAAKLLYLNGMPIYDINQANSNLRNLLKLDEITEINGFYKNRENGKEVEKIEPITKQNFYNAFYSPIWENLTVSEKVKSLEWMFENVNEKYNLGLKHISYFLEDAYRLDIKSIYGMYYSPDDEDENDKPILFVNLNDIVYGDAFPFVQTMGHELMHARQEKYLKKLKNPSKDFYSMSVSNEYYDSYFDDGYINLDKNTKFALYRTSQTEKSAELQGLKYVFKYYKLNKEKFGLNTDDKLQLDNLLSEILFEYGGKSQKRGKIYYNLTFGICANEDIILKGQSDNLFKIYFLIKYINDELEDTSDSIYDCKATLEDITFQVKSGEIKREDAKKLIDECNVELKKLREDKKFYREKLKTFKAAFMDTLQNGEIPEYFDQEDFNILGLKEMTSNPLPKWLNQNPDADLNDMKFIEEEAQEQMEYLKNKL